MQMLDFFNFEILQKNLDRIATSFAMVVLQINSKLLNMYYYIFANSIMQIHVIKEDTTKRAHETEKETTINTTTQSNQMQMYHIYSLWYEYMPYFIGYPGFVEISKGFRRQRQFNNISLVEIRHTSWNATYTTLVTPQWFREQHTYGQLVQSLNDVVKNKSNTRIHNIVCVSIENKCDLTEFYNDFKHSLNVIKMTSAQFCMYFVLKRPKYAKIVRSDDTLTLTDTEFKETTLKNIQYIN